MKKTLFSFSTLFLLVTHLIAQVPNNSFENWSTDGSISAPDHYLSTDIWNAQPTVNFTYPIAVSQYTPGHSGTYAVKLQNIIGTIYTTNIDTLAGQIINSENRTDLYANYGFPYTQRPSILAGYYMFNQGGSGKKIDTGFVSIIFTSWNPATKKTDTIGGGTYSFYENQTSYKEFSIAISYISNAIPDTSSILCSSSNDNAIVSTNTYLILDDFSFTTTTTAIQTVNYSNEITPCLYPNPPSSQITIDNLVAGSSIVQITDITGQKVKSINVNDKSVKIDVNGLQAGMYYYSILDASDSILYSNRFVINP